MSGVDASKAPLLPPAPPPPTPVIDVAQHLARLAASCMAAHDIRYYLNGIYVEPREAGGVVSADEMRRQMRVALDKRINIRGGRPADNDPVDIGWLRDARSLDDIIRRRVRVYQFERPEMRAKFGHLLASYND